MSRTMPFDCPGCGKVLDWGDFGPSGNDPDQAELDKPQCTCHDWVWSGDFWVGGDTPNPAAETLPNVQEPNPYRFTVVVDAGIRVFWVDIVAHDGGRDRNLDMWRFDTKEEADTHAALILAALHQATLEGN